MKIDGIKLFSSQRDDILESQVSAFLYKNRDTIDCIDMKVNVAQPEKYDFLITTILVIYRYKPKKVEENEK